MPDATRYLTKISANELADRISFYWFKRGYKIKTQVYKATSHPKCRDWCVRSNLFRGYPRAKDKI